MHVINLAHGELVVLAAYVAYTCESQLGLNPLLAIPAAVIVVCAAALCLAASSASFAEGATEVFQVIFHLVPCQLEFVGHGRDRARLPEHIGNLLSQGHARTL